MPRLIKNWAELAGLESENYYLAIDVEACYGWIMPKVETEVTQREYYDHHVYLSTHTFYGEEYKHSTKLLQQYGFDVEIDNWDKG